MNKLGDAEEKKKHPFSKEDRTMLRRGNLEGYNSNVSRSSANYQSRDLETYFELNWLNNN